jgi:hypothetical protein
VAAEPVTVLQASGEGGSIKLLGQRSFPLFDSGPATYEDPFESWDEALGALDYYPWTELHPTFVHPAFKNYVLQAVSERTRDPRLLKKWHDMDDVGQGSIEGLDGVNLSEWGFQVVTDETALDDRLQADD